MSDPDTACYLIERQIEFDAGHRVTHHGSKCRNLHGHRYRVIAVCQGGLARTGAQQGMVLDFGFLKEEMLREIHDDCDHAMILWQEDPLARTFIGDTALFDTAIQPAIAASGFYRAEHSMVGSLYLIGTVPTAENLAAHWFARLRPRIGERSGHRAHLCQIKVFETPNCLAAYPAHPAAF